MLKGMLRGIAALEFSTFRFRFSSGGEIPPISTKSFASPWKQASWFSLLGKRACQECASDWKERSSHLKSAKTRAEGDPDGSSRLSPRAAFLM